MIVTQEMIIKVVESQETHGCIVCGAKYFHTPVCRHGIGLPADELVRRIQERFVKLQPVTVHQCGFCGGTPTGTLWVTYHRSLGVVTARPACDACQSSYTDPDGRDFGFIPGITTKSLLEVENILK